MGIIRQFTLDEALERAAVEPPANAQASRKPDTGWSGAPFDEAMKMARNGDPEAALDLNQRVGVEASIRPSSRPKLAWGETGSSVDVARYISGEPECMTETVRRRSPSPVIKIAIERGVSYHVSAEDIRATGASVLAAVKMLRTMGVPSEIWATFTFSGSKGQILLSTQVLIQEAGRPIDVARLAFWTVNPAALRRIAFALEEQESSEIRNQLGVFLGGGYGNPTTTIGDFDEIAPAHAHAVQGWIADVLSRRAGITMKEDTR